MFPHLNRFVTHVLPHPPPCLVSGDDFTLEGVLRASASVSRVVVHGGRRPLITFQVNSVSFDLLFVSLPLASVNDLMFFPAMDSPKESRSSPTQFRCVLALWL